MIKTSIGEFENEALAIDALEKALGAALKPKPKPKSKLLFILTMPENGAWNGKWTGEGRVYARTYDAKLYPGCKEGSYTYSWKDGWRAEINVKKVTAAEARKYMKKSEGFCGYDWMIDSILTYGEILNSLERAERAKEIKEKQQNNV